MYKNNLHFRYILLRGHLELVFIIDYIKPFHPQFCLKRRPSDVNQIIELNKLKYSEKDCPYKLLGKLNLNFLIGVTPLN